MSYNPEVPDFSDIFAYPARKFSIQEERADQQAMKQFKNDWLPYYHRYMVGYSRFGESYREGLLRVSGQYYRARKHAGILRAELVVDLIAQDCPVSSVELAAFENAFIPVDDLAEQFTPTFKQIVISRLQGPTSTN